MGWEFLFPGRKQVEKWPNSHIDLYNKLIRWACTASLQADTQWERVSCFFMLAKVRCRYCEVIAF